MIKELNQVNRPYQCKEINAYEKAGQMIFQRLECNTDQI